jgi:hypothetical protein
MASAQAHAAQPCCPARRWKSSVLTAHHLEKAGTIMGVRAMAILAGQAAVSHREVSGAGAGGLDRQAAARHLHPAAAAAAHASAAAIITSTEVILAGCHSLPATLAALSIIAASQHPANSSSNSAWTSGPCGDCYHCSTCACRVRWCSPQAEHEAPHISAQPGADRHQEGPSGQ